MVVRVKIMPSLIWVVVCFLSFNSFDNRSSFVGAEKRGVNHRATSAIQPRIIGGTEAPEDRYSYAVSLVEFGAHFCGGTVVAPDLVLTAAHCIGATSVEIGRHDRNDPTDGFESLQVLLEIPHPNYRSNENHFDQQILKLWGTTSAQPVRLNENADFPVPGQETTVFGWGLTEDNNDQSMSPVLNEVSVFVLSNLDCSKAKNPRHPFANYRGDIYPDMICANDVNEDSCQGDSGGPLIVRGANALSDVQVGIVSWGYGCAIAGFPGVYSRTSADFSWLRQTICDESANPPAYLNCNGGTSPGDNTVSNPSGDPVFEGNLDAEIVVRMDQFPKEVGFQIEKLGFSSVSILSRSAGSYTESEMIVTENIKLEEGELYSFSIFDLRSDGFCCSFGDGYYELTIGQKEIIKSPGDIGDGREHIFVASENDPTTPPPGPVQPGDLFITLEINFDGFPLETGWVLRRLDSNEIAPELIAFRPPKSYGTEFANSQDVLIINIPDEGGEFTFDLTDSYADGLCCENGNGSYRIYLGNVDGPILAEGKAEGVERERQTFSIEGNTAGQEPQQAPPTISPAPTNTPVPLTIEIVPDRFPGDIGLAIEDDDGGLVWQRKTGSYNESHILTPVVETVSLESSKAFKFTIFDLYEDGICCLRGDGSYKLSNSNGLIQSGGNFKDTESTWFATEGDLQIDLTITTDEYPAEVSWSLVRSDLLSGPAIVARLLNDTYFRTEVQEQHQFLVDQGGLYRFWIKDNSPEEDGICCGFGEGSFEIDNAVGAPVQYAGDYGKESWVSFLAGTTLPKITIERRLTLEIMFDEFPDEIAWFLVRDERSAVSTSRFFHKEQRVIAFGPERPYQQSLFNQRHEEVIVVEQVPQGDLHLFTLTIEDTFGDGLCCEFGSGSWRLFDGPVVNAKLIMAGSFNGPDREVRSFSLSTNGFAEVDAPTLPPNIMIDFQPPSSANALLLSELWLSAFVSVPLILLMI